MMVDAGLLQERRSAAHTHLSAIATKTLRTASNVHLADPPTAGSPEAKALARDLARSKQRAGTGFTGADPNRPSARGARAKFHAAGSRKDPGVSKSWLYAPWAAQSSPEKAVAFSLTRKQRKVARLLTKKQAVQEEIRMVQEQLELANQRLQFAASLSTETGVGEDLLYDGDDV